MTLAEWPMKYVGPWPVSLCSDLTLMKQRSLPYVYRTDIGDCAVTTLGTMQIAQGWFNAYSECRRGWELVLTPIRATEFSLSVLPLGFSGQVQCEYVRL